MSTKDKGQSVSPNDAKPVLYAVAKKVVIEHWLAELPNGETVSLKTSDVSLLGIKDGQPINGQIVEKEVQDRYSNGEHARSYSVHKWFEVENNGIYVRICTQLNSIKC